MAQVRQGYILTSHWEDKPNGHIIRFFGQGSEGPFELVIQDQKPVLFVERSSETNFLRTPFERKPVGLKNFQAKDVDALYFQTRKELFEACDELKARGVRTFESDISTPERFLMERFIKGSIEFIGDSRGEEKGVHIFVNPKVRPGNYTPCLSTASVDIETSRSNDLFSIATHFCRGDEEVRRVYMVGEDQGSLSAEARGELFYFPDEKGCYEAFFRDFHRLDPDILIGWHVVGFDLAFLERKCRHWGIELALGRKQSRAVLKERASGQQVARLRGRVVVDGPPALRAAFYQFEDFKLDTVASEVLGVSKDISSTGLEKIAEIERRFREDKPSLAKYNLLDCELVTQIYEKVGLLDLIVKRTLISGLLFDRVGASAAAFDFIMLPQIHRKGFVAPNAVDVVRGAHTAGGYVLEPNVGNHDYVALLDFKSLYPSIIRTFKIDPYSRMKAESNPLSTPAGIRFSKTDHILPLFVEELMERREEAKSRGETDLSQAIKILMNSFYGVMGSANCRFYHADLPTAITGTGQWVLREAVDFIQNEGYQVVYGDTDSVFVKLKEEDRTRLFEKGESLAKRTTAHVAKILEKHFQVESKLEMEFEKLFKKFFLPEARHSDRGAKKKYAGLLLLPGGREELYFSGMEFVRSDWTSLAKKFQWKLFERFFQGQDVEDCIKDIVGELKEGLHDSELVYKKRLAKKLEEYTKSIPPHVRAAKRLQEEGRPVGRDIYYVMTRRGPIPVDLDHSDLDYQHYIDKQIRPIAETVLLGLGKNFDNIIIGDQLTLF